jgi:hypothetical protein
MYETTYSRLDKALLNNMNIIIFRYLKGLFLEE